VNVVVTTPVGSSDPVPITLQKIAPALFAFWRFSTSRDLRTTRDRDLLRDTALYTIL